MNVDEGAGDGRRCIGVLPSSLSLPFFFASFHLPSGRSREGEKSICYFFEGEKREKWVCGPSEISTLLVI